MLAHLKTVFAFFLGVACWAAPPALPTQPRPGEVVPWEAEIRAAAGAYFVERAAQVWCESGWRQFAVSPVGAKGPVQAMDPTWKWWEGQGWVPKGSSPFDLGACFAGQNRHMLWLRRYWEPLDKRLAAYNVGQGPVLKAGDRAANIGFEGTDAWLRVLPKETRDYVARNREKRAAITQRLQAAGRLP